MVSLSPSVTLVVDFDGRNNLDEEDQLVRCYNGRALGYVKDSIFQASNADKYVVDLLSLSTLVSARGSSPCPV